LAKALGCCADYVEEPEDPSGSAARLEEGREDGMVGFVIKTNYRARATTGALLQPRNLSGDPA
jgi:hypothetical protein